MLLKNMVFSRRFLFSSFAGSFHSLFDISVKLVCLRRVLNLVYIEDLCTNYLWLNAFSQSSSFLFLLFV